jgi:hypothetical protein
MNRLTSKPGNCGKYWRNAEKTENAQSTNAEIAQNMKNLSDELEKSFSKYCLAPKNTPLGCYTLAHLTDLLTNAIDRQDFAILRHELDLSRRD